MEAVKEKANLRALGKEETPFGVAYRQYSGIIRNGGKPDDTTIVIARVSNNQTII